MHRRHQQLNLPIEVVRTAVAISETGSFSKAGERLGLSQPAVSSQIRRIELLVGGALFRKSAHGSTATELGKLVLYQARKILEANDQLLRLGGTAKGPQPIRLGLSTAFFEKFIKHQTRETLANVVVRVDHSAAIAKAMIDGHIDVACIIEDPGFGSEISHFVVDEYREDLVWVRSRNFVMSPGAPIPLLTGPGENYMIQTLTRHGLSFQVMLDSPDFSAKAAAAEAGIGVTAIPASVVPSFLVRAKEYYLPSLPAVGVLLCSRERTDASSKVLRQLSDLLFPQVSKPTPEPNFDRVRAEPMIDDSRAV